MNLCVCCWGEWGRRVPRAAVALVPTTDGSEWGWVPLCWGHAFGVFLHRGRKGAWG